MTLDHTWRLIRYYPVRKLQRPRLDLPGEITKSRVGRWDLYGNQDEGNALPVVKAWCRPAVDECVAMVVEEVIPTDCGAHKLHRLRTSELACG